MATRLRDGKIIQITNEEEDAHRADQANHPPPPRRKPFAERLEDKLVELGLMTEGDRV